LSNQSFRLQKILDFNIKSKEVKELALISIKGVYEFYLLRLSELNDIRMDKAEKLRNLMLSGVSIEVINSGYVFLSELDKAIVVQDVMVLKSKLAYEDALAVVVEESKRVDMLTKLKEKHLLSVEKEIFIKEQKILDDLVAINYFS